MGADSRRNLRALTAVLSIKIIGTVAVWCVPLLFLPSSVLADVVGIPLPAASSAVAAPLLMFVRMLAWAYLALCVGYGFALAESIRGRRLMGAIWAGIVSNGGASVILIIHGGSGGWESWGLPARVVLWGSAAFTALVTLGLYIWGVRPERRRGGGAGAGAGSALLCGGDCVASAPAPASASASASASSASD
jgi:hypothetical protein